MDKNLQESKYSEESIKKSVKKALELCHDCNINPIVIGGIALDAWAYSRATMDLDLMADFNTESVSLFLDKINEKGYPLDLDYDLATILEIKQIRFYIDGFPIDLLQAWDPEWQCVIQRSTKKLCLGMKVNVPKLEDLIIQKLRVGRPRDMDDAIALCSLNKGILDIDFIKQKIKEFYLTEEWNIVSVAVEPGSL